MLRSLFLTLMVIAGALTAPANAHQIRAAITKVLFNKNTGNLEVMHRFYLHDAEHAVKQVVGTKADIHNSAKTQEAFAKYVSERFYIKPLKGKELALKIVGQEVDGKFFWVYQEVKAPKNLNGLMIVHNALREIWTYQINTVNVEGMGDLKTATFSGDLELLSVEFKNHKEKPDHSHDENHHK
jgi:hypothetical protein